MQKERLDNGLTVIFKQVRNKVVTLDVWVNTGSANEDDKLNGISHFLEHMVFKGTPRYAVGELDKAIMSVGGVWNAGTSKDFTHYHVTVASPFFSKALDAISDMIQNALIDAQELEKEKQVILEEYRRKQDNPYGLLYDELYEVCFRSGPYRRSVIGTFESISALGRDAMLDYFERYYTPENLVLLIVGDVEPAAVIPEVRKAFSGFDRKLRPMDNLEAKSLFQPGERRTLKRDVNQTYMGLAFPAPGIANPDEVFALDLASGILCDGRSSRLYRRLKEDKRLVHSISGGYPSHKFDSFFYVIATLDQENVETAATEITRTMRQLATSPPTPDELAKAKRIIRNSFEFGMETNTGQSGTIGYYYTITGSTEFLETYLERLQAITAEQVAAVADKYFSAQPSMVVLQPDKSQPSSGSDAPGSSIAARGVFL
ncbi:MAG: M16 family metallopeptidase [Candidatus Sumerlaeaceae bacterium]